MRLPFYLQSKIEELNKIRNLERLTISLYSKNLLCQKLYEYYTSRHPRYLIFGRKEIGAAIQKVPISLEEYQRGKSKQVFRTNKNKAKNLGYYVKCVNPKDYISEIMEIHHSAPIRQGRSIDSQYLDKNWVTSHMINCTYFVGVFTNQDILVGYICVLVAGEAVILEQIMGHANHSGFGIMYLLFNDLIQLILSINTNLILKWIVYDTYFGANAGLRYFKDRLGFVPYRVNWKWTELTDSYD